ncbi:MAG: methylenetetrahydrofolate--tRNA-(uracil(54)-C(5))-methyltransferase (FADH(2)-oxidizing) TrmFO, partial [Oscillospiraceae bacterium]
MTINIIGAGLAGCEAAWALACRKINVNLYEMKPLRFSPAHHSENLAELVCSNSLKAARINSASGLLKEEMRTMGSLILEAAESCSVGAGGALAVDRDIFSKLITEKIQKNPYINLQREEITKIDTSLPTIISTGPLSSPAISEEIKRLTGGEHLSFYDAAAPIAEFSSINMKKAFWGARYEKGEPDYINCPFNKEEYDNFYNELILAERAALKEFDKVNVYEGCMPIEILASRGEGSMRFGPLKPVGLRDPQTGRRPWAVVQLRSENLEKSLFNMVGFQTNLKFSEQKRVFSLIPGLENVEFTRYGVMHRNTFINSPKVTEERLTLKEYPNIKFAGQITGVEGYLESAMT